MTPDHGPAGPPPADAAPADASQPAAAPKRVPPSPTPAEASAAPAEQTQPMSPDDDAPAVARRRGAHRPESPWAAFRSGRANRRSAKKLAKAKKPHRKAPWWELPALVALAILIAILVKTFIIQPFYIPSESMEKTLHGCTGCHGDRILVNKLIYDFRDPHPGDIVVFHAPPGWDDEPTTKPPSNPVLRLIRGFGQLVGVVPPDGQEIGRASCRERV